jgi:hypothetical protein
VRRALFLLLALLGLIVAAVVVLVLINARDPYGGPIEPADAH